MADRNTSNWVDDASMDLGRAWGLSFMSTSFLEKVDGLSSEEEKARDSAASNTLRHIATLSKSVAERCEEAPIEVRESVQRAAGVAAVVARETFTEFGMQYRDDITEWALDAVTQALEGAKTAFDGWMESLVRQRQEERESTNG